MRLLLSGRRRRALAPVLDRLVAAEAETGDVRIATLHATLTTVSARMEALAALDAARLAAAIGGALNDKPADERSAGKKKKKKKS